MSELSKKDSDHFYQYPPKIDVFTHDRSKDSVIDKLIKLAKIFSYIFIPVILAYSGYEIRESINEKKLDRDYVNMSISILTESQKKIPTELNDYAVDLLVAKSPIEVKKELISKLKEGKIKLPESSKDIIRYNYRQRTISSKLEPEGNFNRLSLEQIDFSNSDLHNTRIVRSELINCQFVNTNLFGVNFYRSILTGSNFTNATLENAEFIDAELDKANFSGANLKNANLRGALLKNTILEETDLSNANLMGVEELTCSQLKKAKNWSSAYRDPILSCGQQRP